MSIFSELDLIVFDMDKTICYPSKNFPTVFEKVFKFKIDKVSQQWIKKVKIDGACTGMEAVEAVLPTELISEKNNYFEDISRQWAQAQRLFPGMLEFLKALKKKFSGRVIVLTNGPSNFQHCVAEYLGLKNVVDRVYATGDKEIAVRKPSIKCFKKIESICSVRAERCLFIGDSFNEDHLASLQAGWNSIWIKVLKTEVMDNSKIPLEHFIGKMQKNKMNCVEVSWMQYC